MKQKLKTAGAWVNSQKIIYAVALLYIISCIIFADKKFSSFTTLNNIFKRAGSEYGLITLGMTFVMLTGNVDLSVGSVIALVAAVCALTVDISPWLAIACGLIVGFSCGLLNGLIVAKLKLSSFIATLSTMLGLRGVVYIITHRDSLPITDSFFNSIAVIKLGKFSIFGILLIVFTLVCMYIARHTRFGVSLYSVGGNQNAARLMGISVERITIISYIISGLFASITGILLASKLNVAQSVAADGWETTAIACAALGGVKLSGGEGKFSGAFFGVLMVALINTWFNYAGNINAWWSKVIMGVILILAVAIQSEVLHKNARKTLAA